MSGSDLILDTNTIIDYFKQIPLVTTNIKRAERIFIPAVVVGELYYGVQRSSKPGEKKQELEAFLPTAVVLPIDLTTAQLYGFVRAALAKKGKPIPGNDIWIAAVALQHHLPLYTNDAHFREVNGLLLFNPLNAV
jgi:tRNA(fMet)-specific endonuclease VapC